MDWTVSLKDSSKSSTSIPVNMTLFGNGVSANAAKLRILNDIILNLRWVLSSIAISLQGKRRKREKERVPGGSVVKSQSEIQEMQEMRVWSLGRGNGNPLQYSCLENSMDRGAWWATICGITSQTQLSTCTHTHTHTHTHKQWYRCQEGRVKTEAETRMMKPQAKGCLEPSEAGQSKERALSRAFGRNAALPTPWFWILSFRTMRK